MSFNNSFSNMWTSNFKNFQDTLVDRFSKEQPIMIYSKEDLHRNLDFSVILLIQATSAGMI